MILSENGWSDRFAGIAGTSQEDADAAEARWSWLSALLASRDIAACVIEVIRDPGRTDYRIVALSPGFVEATGLVNAAGRCMRDLKPDHEQFWFDLYQRVADTGEPAHFDHPSQALNRRFRGHAFRIGFPGAWRVVVILENSPSMTTPPPGAPAPNGPMGAPMGAPMPSGPMGVPMTPSASPSTPVTSGFPQAMPGSAKVSIPTVPTTVSAPKK